MSVSKSFEDDEDDFNESSLIHTRIPGKKVLIFTTPLCSNSTSTVQLTPSIPEIIWVKNVRAIVVCGFLMK